MAEIELACCLSMADSQTCHHLAPIAGHPSVSRFWIVRSHESRYGSIPRSSYLLAPARSKPLRWVQMLRHCMCLAQRDRMCGFVSFNPFPYGLIASLAARRYGKAMHFGFIGRDWYSHMRSWRGRFLLPLVRHASLITATGEGMRAEMTAMGLDESKISILPHSVDLATHSVGEPEDAAYACIFVGALIARKRVDVIIRSFAKVLTEHPNERLCIVGDGPEKRSLKALAVELGIADSVTFAGFARDVVSHLHTARINIIASSREGFPFSLAEGICCGVVPVSTPVGTISDVIVDGTNGFLVPEGDVDALAKCIGELLANRSLYEAVRKETLRLRSAFAYDKATAVWDPWLTSLAGCGGRGERS